MSADVVRLAQQLVQIPSVNPMGKAVDPAICFEHRLTDFLQQWFQSVGLPWCRYPVHPQRDNILARLEGADPDRVLLLEVHQDTVPVTGMTVEPFGAEVQDGKLAGRGTADVKGSMAVILSVVQQLATLPQRKRPTVVVACTVNEEHGFTGATALTDLIISGESPLLPQRPSAIIVAEPTKFDVVVTHKGVVRWKCRTAGMAAHSSRPEAGVNAIYRMAKVVAGLETYAGEVGNLAEDAILGRPTLSVGTITGGISVNTVPDECSIEIDRRILPQEDPHEARQQTIDFLHAQVKTAGDVVHDPPFIVARGLSKIANDTLAGQLVSAGEKAGVSPQAIGVPFGTDASALSRLGVPLVVFGPGDIAQAHRCDEFIEVDQLKLGEQVLLDFCLSW